MKNLARKILFISAAVLLGLFFAVQTMAQPFNNSWINFSNTYYKFRIMEEGIYRITKSQLDAIGMGAVSGNQFAIFREGQEVPIYTSSNGSFGSNDFIEFYASKADGRMDKQLYPDPSFQPNEDISILSDTAYYFITYDNGVHQRMQLVSNNIPVPAPAPAPYCWMTSYPGTDIRTAWNPGRSLELSHYFYSGDFDLGEGHGYYRGGGLNALFIPTPDIYYAGPVSTFSVVASEHSITSGQLTVAVEGTTFIDTVFNNSFSILKKNIAIPNNVLPSNVTTVSFNDPKTLTVHKASLRYPKGYNFWGLNEVSFQVPANERYLEVLNFNNSTPPRLYDRTNNKIYVGVVSGGISKFYLDASALQRDITIVSSASINNLNNFTAVQFRDYANAANQGDYIILTHKNYINASPNYINDFKSYRSSASGGSHQPVVVDIAELYEQFGYGHEFHPISIKDFIAYANNIWTVKPKFLFIVGKGVSYTNLLAYKQSPATYNYPVVPTWGEPGADNLLSSFNNDQKPILATGRLSAWNNQEIGDYLKKVKDYEEAIRPLPIPTVEHEFWKKTVLHVAGSSDINLQTQLVAALNDCKGIIEDTLVGGVVTTIKKNSTDPVDQTSNAIIDSFMSRGLSRISFYGHGSSSGFDYNLNSPDNYNSTPRFPVFSSFACEVAHIFSLATEKTISEKYIKSINGGSIVMIAGDNAGWTGQLPTYMQNLYKSWSFRDYGKTLGEQYQKNIEFIQNLLGSGSDHMMDVHTQCMLYQGDPGILTYNPEKRDYVIEEPGVSSTPTNVTTALDSFDIKAVVYSLGKSMKDSVWVRLQHTKPGVTTVLYSDSIKISNLLSVDTLKFTVPLNPNTDIGLNNYTIKIDAADQFEELSEENNQATLQIFIYSENLEPVYPKEFAIVHDQDLTLKASTLNAFAPLRKYKLEIDTTENFNSSSKLSTEITSLGGVVKWKPVITYQDSVVYYWRATPDTLINGKYNWSGSSFIYLANGSDGWNQSHYFQYKKDEPYSGITLLPATRKFKFGALNNVLKVEDIIIKNQSDESQVRQSLNDVVLDYTGCYYDGGIQFVVIDSVSGRPWINTNAGLYGSSPLCVNHPNELRYLFEYSTKDSISRKNARLFLESIVPSGNYIMIKNLILHNYWNGKAIDDWKADTLVYGSGKSLYHAIKNLGFDMIDQFTSERVFGFFRKKDDPNYPIRQYISNGINDKIEFLASFNSYPDTGNMESTIIGPALEWETVRWGTSSTDNAPQNDSAYVVVYGVDNSSNQTQLFSTLAKDISLASVNASQYPYLKLKWYSVDNITNTSPQLDYWRVLYKPVPEAALNAAAHFEYLDSLGEGQKGKLRVAIENLTPTPFRDSMLVSYKVIDVNGTKHAIADKRYKKLAGNDTLIADIDFDVSSYHGKNFLFIEANPNNDQPEQYHPNNLGYLNLYVDADVLNPLLDVTFDGVHILDKDIVSAKPMIKVLMRDENKFQALNDTTLMKVQLLYPNQSAPVDVPMDGTTCKFFPAQIVNGHKNEARVEFKPNLPEDGVYKLIVSGKDKAGNVAGNALAYEVYFTVENKPSITNVLNYPNPFSTATQFIFTMTGSEIPSQFKIQILSVTGKVVREIKKSELGNLHIGRNMTDYRWDGKDEYGQMLGNGVYLYRVVTSIRGENIEQRKNANVDKYFKNGYGKLYIMR
ncbi:MAG: C25 family cysteine peptidase [Taibaiella sp.]|jgi:hypothetical protein